MQMAVDSFKKGQDQLRKTAQDNGRDPSTIEFLILAFPKISESDLGSDRLPMNGSVDQIAEDIAEFEKLGINHINLVFDFGSQSKNLKNRLSHAKLIRDSVVN